MKNGEGTPERLSSKVTPPSAYDPLEDELVPLEDQKWDDGDDDEASRYSSCGDSEFDRYCSANSAMGTPSICGSVNEFPESEFGSLRSFKLGSENRILKNFGVEKRLSGFGDHGSSSTGTAFGDASMRNDENLGEMSVNTSKGFGLYQNSETSLNINEVGFVENDDLDAGWRENRAVNRTGDHSSWESDTIEGNVNIGGGEGHIVNLGIGYGSFESVGSREDSEVVKRNPEDDLESPGGAKLLDGCLGGLHLSYGLDCQGEDVGRCLDEDEASLGHEYSEGEDSMFGDGSDDDKKTDSYIFSKVGYSRGEEHGKDANELLMTSAVAFGSDDWDDFMQESGGNTLHRPSEDEFHGARENAAEDGIGCLDFTSGIAVAYPGIISREPLEEVVDFPRTKVQVQDSSEPIQPTDGSVSQPFNLPKSGEVEQGKYCKSLLAKDNNISSITGVLEYPETSVFSKYEADLDPPTDGIPLLKGPHMGKTEPEEVHQYTTIDEVTSVHGNLDQENLELEKMYLPSNPLSRPDTEINKLYAASKESAERRIAEFVKENESSSSSMPAYNGTQRIMQNSPIILDHLEDHFSSIEKEKFDSNGFYDEMVHEMEEILLDTEKLPCSRFIQSNRAYQPQIPLPSRDGGSTASTSGTDDAYFPRVQPPVRIDGVEVIGSRQKKGDVSFSERLVGVKEHTVYRIRVWSGEDKWEVEHRYRDFCALYHQLKKMFSDQGWSLPSPWQSLEQESRKIFSNASPDVTAQRGVLIQDCLQSILQSQLSSSSLNALIYFLSPSKASPSSSLSAIPTIESPFSTKVTDNDHVSMLGKTLSLIVQIPPTKPTKQMLDAQNHSCAGCHKNFDDSRTRIKELIKTFGWGKPRLCEYSGQLFCSTCHTNDTAVLPARVLHLWDFTRYPVSQIAKSYLDSIYDKPMLCVSAVNPFLFSKVPALHHVTNVRKRIGAMIPYVHCPFRRSIYKALGTRKYLLESNDFFALRDLIDLSKGMFAVLPERVEDLLSKILEHITEQCLICCDTGIPCNARQACHDPSALIFPFQEGEIERCRSCNAVFHRPCFSKIVTCPCGARLHQEAAKGSTTKFGHNVGSEAELRRARRDAGTTSAGFLSGLFSKVTQRSVGHKEQSPKDGDNVILMGSLPALSEPL